MEEIPDDQIFLYLLKLFEIYVTHRLRSCSKVRGEMIEQGVTILNIKKVGINFTRRCMKYIKMASNLTQNYFPETLGIMFVIYSSSVFSVMWSLVKPFVDEKTRKKIHVYKDDFIGDLSKCIDMENIPSIIGGQCECQGGCINSDKGPWNP